MNDMTVSAAALAWTVGCVVMTGVASGLIWLVRLEGRVKSQDALLIKLDQDLRYIRGRLDRFVENGSDEDDPD